MTATNHSINTSNIPLSQLKPRLTENTFNEGLGTALRHVRHEWLHAPDLILVEKTNLLAERNSLRPDLLITGKGLQPTIIETSFNARDADKDARSRLGRHYLQGNIPVLATLALHIDPIFRGLNTTEDVRKVILNGARLRYALHQQQEPKADTQIRRWPEQGFISGSIFDLSHFLTSEALPKYVLEKVAKDVALRIRQAAFRFQSSVAPTVLDDLREVLQQRTHLTSLHTTILVQLQLHRDGNPVTKNLSVLHSLPVLPRKLRQEWDTILQHNWYSVFQPAVTVLQAYASKDLRGTSHALELLIEAAELIETSRISSQFNIGAELFPELADDRKESAAFYTQPATAELLADLTIRNSDLTTECWADPMVLNKHCIADFACGTGTLLRAAYRRVLSLHEYESAAVISALDDFHKNAVEHGLIGTDISPIAAHLTTASLAIMNLKQEYSKTRVGWLVVGGPKALTGSLEYLESDHVTDLFDEMGSVSVGNQETANAKELTVADNSVDWILMNPPYSRTRGGQAALDVAGMDEKTRTECQKRWGKLIHNLPAIKTAGMAASYLVLAKKKIKPSGRIGFVLPLTAAFAPSWKSTRAMLLEEFHDILAIAVLGGKALGKQALSADTGMEEMLLIATRNSLKTENLQGKNIFTVTLFEPTHSVGQSAEIARSILTTKAQIQHPGDWRPLKVGKDEIGHIELGSIANPEYPWSQLGTLNPHFYVSAKHLTEGRLFWQDRCESWNLPMTTLSAVFNVGPTHDLIGYPVGGNTRGAFEIHELNEYDSESTPDLSLWRADSETQQQLLVRATHKALPRYDRRVPRAEQNMRQTASTLLYSRNMRWTSQAILAGTTTKPLLGGRSWTTLQHERNEVCLGFSLWANSTLGLITHWTQGQRTHTGRSTTQINALRVIPCPDFSQLHGSSLAKAQKHFESLHRQRLLPANQAFRDPVRKEIDRAILDILELPPESINLVQELCDLWCNEPSVRGDIHSFESKAEH